MLFILKLFNKVIIVFAYLCDEATAMREHLQTLLPALLLIRFYLETVDLSVVQSRGCPQWCAEDSNADCIRAHRPVPGAVPWRRAQNSHNVQRYALTHSPNHSLTELLTHLN